MYLHGRITFIQHLQINMFQAVNIYKFLVVGIKVTFLNIKIQRKLCWWILAVCIINRGFEVPVHLHCDCARLCLTNLSRPGLKVRHGIKHNIHSDIAQWILYWCHAAWCSFAQHAVHLWSDMEKVPTEVHRPTFQTMTPKSYHHSSPLKS